MFTNTQAIIHGEANHTAFRAVKDSTSDCSDVRRCNMLLSLDLSSSRLTVLDMKREALVTDYDQTQIEGLIFVLDDLEVAHVDMMR